jgi:hypothetical protein
LSEAESPAKEAAKLAYSSKPSTVNQEYFQAMIRNRSANFSFPVLQNFIASCYEELAKAGSEDYPEKKRYFIYHAGVQAAWPAISKEARKAWVDNRERLDSLYRKLKPMLNQCGEIKFKIVRTAGNLSEYTISVFYGGASQSFPSAPENLETVIRLAEEEAYRKLNCDSAKKFALCVLLLDELDLFSFDYSIDIKEDVPSADKILRDR